ncbi:hypothetical protein ACLMMA_04055 [Micrococcus luteus]
MSVTYPKAVECPAGAVVSRLDHVEMAPMQPYMVNYQSSFHGDLTNSTSADIVLVPTEIPRVEGLDGKGEYVLGRVTGQYEHPGGIGGPAFVLHPDESIGFTASAGVVPGEYVLGTIFSWHTDTARGSIYGLSFRDPLLAQACTVGRDSYGSGQTVPNTYRR